jgi:hypothetical protein
MVRHGTSKRRQSNSQQQQKAHAKIKAQNRKETGRPTARVKAAKSADSKLQRQEQVGISSKCNFAIRSGGEQRVSTL